MVQSPSTSTSASIPTSSLKSILNFRDVNQSINNLNPTSKPLLKPRLLYRSARPDQASIEDRQALTENYHIKTILDLRSNSEHVGAAKKLDAQNSLSRSGQNVNGAMAAASPSAGVKLPGVKYEEIDIHGGPFIRAMVWKLSWRSMSRLMWLMALGYRDEAIGLYAREVMVPRGLVGLGKDSLDLSKGEILACFKILANPENYPVLVHCTQGKDRTGLIVLLTLLLLDVPIEAVKADYMASERGLEVDRESRIKELKSIGLGKEFAECPAGFVEAIKGYIDEKWGGVEEYLEECGVDSRMREKVRWKLLVEGEQ